MNKIICCLGLLLLCVCSGIAQTSTSTEIKIPATSSGLTAGTTIVLSESCQIKTLDAEVDLKSEQIVVTHRKDCYLPASFTYAVACGFNGCDFSTHTVYKDIYKVVAGKLTHLKTITGKIIPASKKEESFEWPDSEN